MQVCKYIVHFLKNMHWAGFWHWIEHENCITHIFDDKFLNSKKGIVVISTFFLYVPMHVTSFFKYVDGIHKLCIVETVHLMSWEVFFKMVSKIHFLGLCQLLNCMSDNAGVIGTRRRVRQKNWRWWSWSWCQSLPGRLSSSIENFQ